MRTSLPIMIGLALASGCKKKQDGDKGSATPPGGETATGAASGAQGASAGDPTSATTEALGELKPVNECPPALQGTDKGLARTIPAGCTTVVEGEYYVEGGTLVIEAGAVLKFKPDAALYLAYSGAAKLEVRGTKEKPVTFTSAGDAVAGAWRGVHLYPRAARSSIAWLVIEHAQKAIEIEAPDVKVEDSTFRNIKELGVNVHTSLPAGSFARNTFEKTEGRPMSVPPEAMIGFGAGNTFPAGATVELRAGSASTSGAWQNPGAPLHVTGEVYVEGKAGTCAIEIAAGTAFRFDSAAAIYVGYSGEGELRVKGTQAAPITFGSSGEKIPGAWENGFIVYPRGNLTVEHALIEHGGREKHGALRGEGGKLSVTATRFENNVVGMSIDDATDLRAFDQNTLTSNKDAALIVFPRHVGVLGAANTYSAAQVIDVQGGRVEKAVTWALQPGAKPVVSGEVYIENGGSVTIPAGTTYAFTEGGAIYVGYSGDGTLIVKGTADKPVTLSGVRDEVGTWKGIELYSRARSSVLEHVVVKNAGENGGVRVSGGGTVTVTALSCAKCQEAALRWDCGSKVTQSGVKGEAGTAKGALAPEGC